ncbi:hypothetical protein [Methylobacterium sp. CM6244]
MGHKPKPYADSTVRAQPLAGERTCWRGSRLAIDYEAGWLLPGEPKEVNGVAVLAEDLPADIERAVIQLVGVAASMSGRDVTIKSEDVEGVGKPAARRRERGVMLRPPR